ERLVSTVLLHHPALAEIAESGVAHRVAATIPESSVRGKGNRNLSGRRWRHRLAGSKQMNTQGDRYCGEGDREHHQAPAKENRPGWERRWVGHDHGLANRHRAIQPGDAEAVAGFDSF